MKGSVEESAVRFLVGGGDVPPLDLSGESDLPSVLSSLLSALSSSSSSFSSSLLLLGSSLLCAHARHELVGPPLPPALLAVAPAASVFAAAQLGCAPASSLHLLWLAREVLLHQHLDKQEQQEQEQDQDQSSSSSSSSSSSLLSVSLWRARLWTRVREAASSSGEGELRREHWAAELRAWSLVRGCLPEKALALGGQNRWTEALRVVQQAKQEAGLRAVLSGKMGKRTKYQTFECAQLVLQVEVEDPQEEEEDDKEKKDLPVEVHLEEDSILLDREQRVQAVNLTGEQQSLLVLEALCIARRHARDELTLGLSLPYVEQVLASPTSPFAVRTAALFVRSLLEAHMSKTRDRAALQLEALYEDWQGLHPEAKKENRMHLVWSTPVATRRNVLLEAARAYMRIGAVTTAGNMFEKLGRVREQMSCLVVAGKPHAAGQLCEDLLVHAEGNKRWELLCLLGELREQPALWEQAWQESGERCALARRMSGRRAQQQGDLETCEKHLGLALALAPSFPETSFSRGCALLALGRAAEAAQCFAAAVHGLPDDGQAWANLSVALRASEQLEQALVAGEQAARHLNRDWRVQLNLATLAMLMHRPQLAVQAARAVVSLLHSGVGAAAAADTESSSSSPPVFELLVQLSALPAAEQPRHLRELLDEACEAWPAHPAPYALRADAAAARGDARAAALDAGRSARLLRTRLSQEPNDETRLERVVRAMLRQAELVAAAQDQEQKSALREAVAQLVAVYGDKIRHRFAEHFP